MTPKKKKTRAKASTTWRERYSQGHDERQSFWAMRRQLSLTVTVSRISPDRALVLARVTGSVGAPEGEQMRWELDASNAPADAKNIDAQVELAKQWACNEADRLAAVRA